jgi:curved DNA-binding protein CbpA
MHQPLLPYTPERDVYRLLGVSSSASSDEILAACRRLARTFHPDRNTSVRANQEMQVVNAVRRAMTDPGTRAAYDRERARFHATRARFAAAVTQAPPSAGRREGPPAPIAGPVPSTTPAPPPPMPAVGRYVRAAGMGLRALLAALSPARCRTCRIVIDERDSYCAACGTKLLTGA